MPHAGRPGESCPLLPGRVRTALVTYTDRMVEDRPGRSPHVLRWRAPVRRWLTTGVAIAGLLTVAIGVEAALGQPGPNTPSPLLLVGGRGRGCPGRRRSREGGAVVSQGPRDPADVEGGLVGARDHPLRTGRARGRRARVSTPAVARSEERHRAPDAGALRVPARRRRERAGEHPDRQNARGSDGWRACRRCSTYHEGMLLLRAGRYERALETLQPLVSAGVDDENLELALGMGVLLMRPNDAPPEELADARGSCCVRAAPSVITWPRSSRPRRRDYAALVQRRADVSQRALRLRPLPARRRRISRAGSQEFLKEIEAHPGARARPHAGRRRALPRRFGGGPPVRARGGEARARLSVRPLPARPALLRYRRRRARDSRARDRSPHAARRSAVPVRARQRVREGGPRGRRPRGRARPSFDCKKNESPTRATTRCGASTSTLPRVRPRPATRPPIRN